MTETPAHPPAAVPTITEALARVMDEVGAVGKGDVNRDQGFSFRGIDAVVNAVSPALRKHRVLVRPELLAIDYGTAPTRSGGTMTICRVQVAYTFAGPAGDSLTTVVPAEAFDAGDKATSKAMSVAFRTALLQTLALPTHEKDPDQDTYERADHQVERETRQLPGPRHTTARPPRYTPQQVEAWMAEAADAVASFDPGPRRDDELRTIYRNVQGAGALEAIVDALPEGWPVPDGPPTLHRLLTEVARRVRLEGDPGEES